MAVKGWRSYEKVIDAQERRYKAGARKGAAKRGVKAPKPPPPKLKAPPSPRLGNQRLARQVRQAHPHVNRGAGPLQDDARQLPRLGSGVFFFILGGEVVYVGAGAELRMAMMRAADAKLFDQVLFYSITRSAMREVETAFIRVLRPVYNRRSLTDPPPTPRHLAFTSRYNGPRIKG